MNGIIKNSTKTLLATILIVASFPSWAGSFIAGSEGGGEDRILHIYDYMGNGGDYTVYVCIDRSVALPDGTPYDYDDLEQSVRNIAAVYNQKLPTTGNMRNDVAGGSQLDFESVALHELGHCLGKGHVNSASESGLTWNLNDSTKSTDGANNTWNVNDGADNVYGSSDDIRGDDINMHWFRTANNHPFTMDYQTVDASTYTIDIGDLPAGHNYAANGDRDVANLLDTPNTEAVMQQGSYYREIQRTLTPDGVATLQLGMAGSDEVQGTSDDYTFNVEYTEDMGLCEVAVNMDITGGGLAYCSVGWSWYSSNSDHPWLTSGSMHFNPGYNWYFNTDQPCSKSLAIAEDALTMFSLPCSVGISTGDTVGEVLGDDMTGMFYADWFVLDYDTDLDFYLPMAWGDKLEPGRGYIIYNALAGQNVTVTGQYPGAPDIKLEGIAAGLHNLVGHPFDFPVAWPDVQVIVGAEVKTMAQAAGDGDLPGTYYTWNGAASQTVSFDTPGLTGTLDPFDGVWVEAFTDDIYLRVKKTTSGGSNETVAPSATMASLESAGRSSGKLDGKGKRESEYFLKKDGSWYMRLIAESGDMVDGGNVLGQLPESKKGKDRHDLEEYPPFEDDFLTIVFPHKRWKGDAWGYTSDYRKTTRTPKGKWKFAVLSSPEVEEVTVRMEGPPKILRHVTVKDLTTGRKARFKNGAYTFTSDGTGERLFELKLAGFDDDSSSDKGRSHSHGSRDDDSSDKGG